MEKKSVKRNITYQLIYRVLLVLTPIITSPYLSRVLGPEQLGIFSSSYAFVCYFILFSMLGIEAYGIRTIALKQHDIDELSKTFFLIYRIQLIASMLSMFVYIILINNVLHDIDIDVKMFQGLFIIAAGLDINWFYFGCENFKFTVSRNIVVKVINVILILVCVNVPSDLNIYILIMAGSLCVSNGILWIGLPKYIKVKKIKLEECRQHFVPIMKLFIPVLATSVFHIMDKTMLSIMSDAKMAGYYYSVDRLVAIPIGIITALCTVMLPKMTQNFEKKNHEEANKNLNFSFELNSFLIILIAFGIGSVAKEFVPVFFGAGYEICVVLLIIFIPILIIKSYGEFLRTQILIPLKRDNAYIMAVIVGALVNLCSNYFLIKKYGVIGAVIGTGLAESAVVIVEIICLKGDIKFSKFVFENISYFLSAIIMVLSIRGCANLLSLPSVLGLLVEIMCGGGVYVICCIVYWWINEKSVFHNMIKIICKGSKNCV